jgi:hypothetical protein
MENIAIVGGTQSDTSGKSNAAPSNRVVSRRSFIGIGSTALVTAAFSGKADGQMRQQDSAWSEILKGKVAVVTGAARGIGRSAAVALARSGAKVAGIDICATVDPRSGVTPATKADRSNAAHYVENTGDTDLVVLELFATDQFMDVSLNQWLRRVPSEMLKAHLNIDKEMAMKIPAEKLELV